MACDLPGPIGEQRRQGGWWQLSRLLVNSDLSSSAGTAALGEHQGGFAVIPSCLSLDFFRCVIHHLCVSCTDADPNMRGVFTVHVSQGLRTDHNQEKGYCDLKCPLSLPFNVTECGRHIDTSPDEIIKHTSADRVKTLEFLYLCKYGRIDKKKYNTHWSLKRQKDTERNDGLVSVTY